MGDPKKLKKKYSTPNHPWNKVNIDAERAIKKEYGLRNKKEIFIAQSFLKKYKDLAKKLVSTTTPQEEKEKEQILTRLQRLGLLSAGAALDQVLGLELKDVLERRLQSVVFRKDLARSMKQARQFITHRHITVGGKEVSIPSYLLTLEEESLIEFKEKSALASLEHPERAREEKQKQAPSTPAQEGAAQQTSEQATEQGAEKEAQKDVKKEAKKEETPAPKANSDDAAQKTVQEEEKQAAQEKKE